MNDKEDQTILDQAVKDRKVLHSWFFTNSFYMAANAINNLHGHGQ